MKLTIFIAALATSILFASCAENKTDNHGEETENHDEHENENTATLTDEQIKSIGIEYGNIEKKELTASLKLNGHLRVPNDNQASVTALLGGVINTLHVQQGNSVKKGQVIATLTNTRFISMQEEFLTISSKLSLAKIEYERQSELQQGNATSLRKLQEAESEMNVLKAQKSSLKKQLSLLGINTASLNSDNMQSALSIKSPINGVISDISVNIGSFVDPNTPIVKIVDNSQLHLDLFVYEKDLSKLKVGQIIHFTLTNNPGKEYDAEVYAISNTFESNSKTVAVHANVKGEKQGLIDGMSITALVSLEKAMVNAVPINSIVSHEGQDYIFIVTDAHAEEEHHEDESSEKDEHDEHGHKHEEEAHEHKEEGITFEKIPIRKGTTEVGYSEITLLKEIPANCKIVVNGAFFILAKMNNKGEGHAH